MMNMRGANYGFTPQAFTAGTVNATTINATTVNATTLNGCFEREPVAGVRASGSGHAPGAVPDPGAAAGASRYLREDGTWVTRHRRRRWRRVVWRESALPVSGATADYHFLKGTGTVADATRETAKRHAGRGRCGSDVGDEWACVCDSNMCRSGGAE